MLATIAKDLAAAYLRGSSRKAGGCEPSEIITVTRNAIEGAEKIMDKAKKYK